MIDKETILRLARESGLNDFGIAWQLDKLQAFSTAILAHRAESGVEVPEPQPVNESGSTMTVIRWMVETPHGWVGAWDKGAITGLLLDYGNARAAEALDRAANSLTKLITMAPTSTEAIAIALAQGTIRSLTP